MLLALRTALELFRTRKVRFLLTISGILVDVASLVLLAGLLDVGQEVLRRASLSALGDDTLTVKNDWHTVMDNPDAKALTWRDQEAMERSASLPEGTAITVVHGIQERKATLGKEETKVIPVGVEATAFVTYDLTAARRRAFVPVEFDEARRVAIASAKVLDGRLRPGDFLRVEGTPYLIVGVLEAKPTVGPGNNWGWNNRLLMPARTYQMEFDPSRRPSNVVVKIPIPEDYRGSVKDYVLATRSILDRILIRGRTVKSWEYEGVGEEDGIEAIILKTIQILVYMTTICGALVRCGGGGLFGGRGHPLRAVPGLARFTVGSGRGVAIRVGLDRREPSGRCRVSFHPSKAAVLLLLLPGCRTEPGGKPEDTDSSRTETEESTVMEDETEHVWDPERVLRVELSLEPKEWEELRTQTRDRWELFYGEGCQEQPFESPFTWFQASLSLDGEELGEVGLRKKGFIGSLAEDRPSMILDLDRYVDERAWFGVDRLTLNNCDDDPSFVRQCIIYGLFRDAGLPASRCALAHVWVNGEDLGVYANVEPVRGPMLRRFYASDAGNLYEGTLSDFREGWTGTFERESGEDADDAASWSDIHAAVLALKANDDELLDALDPVFDLEAFLSFLSMEVLVSHLDGYGWNTNNFHIYADPADGRFDFIPWGVEASLMPANEHQPASIFAHGMLANRLYLHPDGQRRYLERLQELLASTWDEALITSRIDALAALIEGEVADADTWIAEVSGLKDFVESRRPAIEAELAKGAFTWEEELREGRCLVPEGTLEMSFSTTWGSVEDESPYTFGDASLAFHWEELDYVAKEVGAVAGLSGDRAIVLLSTHSTETEVHSTYVLVDASSFQAGACVVAFEPAIGVLAWIDTASMTSFEVLAYLSGELTLVEAGMDEGDSVIGSFSGDLLGWGL